MMPLDDIEAIKRMALAMLLGALIGLERERAEKPAGVRTYMLVSQGAALFMICGILLSQQLKEFGVVSDPGRIASTVVQGIGFLAGGVILSGRGGTQVRGVTTAASIWVVAAIGLLVGAGFWLLGTAGAVAVLLALTVVRRLEEKFPFSPKSEEPPEELRKFRRE